MNLLFKPPFLQIGKISVSSLSVINTLGDIKLSGKVSFSDLTNGISSSTKKSEMSISNFTSFDSGWFKDLEKNIVIILLCVQKIKV
jgi:hypothetical protein